MLFMFMISLGWAGGRADLPEGPPPTVDELRGARGDVPALPPEDTVVTRIAFGSCLGQGEPAPIFETIRAREPRMMVMLGDNVYGDDKTGDPSLPMLRAAYGQLAQNPYFRSFSASVPVVPMWDDHDFGLNDAGGEFPFKKQSERIFEAFWGVGEDDPRASRDGVYTSYTFGPTGQRIQLILVDTRMHRSKLQRMGWGQFWRKGRYKATHDPHQAVLSREQWRWLEAELNEPADLRIVVSSIQILPTRSGWEHWGQFPMERAKMMDLLHRRDNLIVVSGDRHWASMYRDDFGMLEMTTTSLNRPARPTHPERDTLQIRKPITATNFGEIEVDWEQRIAHTRVITADGEIALSEEFVF